jgi:hypothetical protein
MTRDDIVSRVEKYAEEAENGNYHDLCAVLYELANIIKEDKHKARYIIIKSVDETPLENNIVVLEVQ